MRVAVLGGSGVASVQLAQALRDWPGGAERRPPLSFSLHGRNPSKLELVAGRFKSIARGIAETESTTEIERVLEGADVVLVQVRIGGMQARSFDESFPHDAGLPGEETLGPGGFANALRTLRALAGIWESIKARTPDATVLVLTNPAGMVRQQAACHGLRALEVCDSPIAFIEQLAGRLEKRPSEVTARYCGMNHVGWYVPVDEDELERLSSGQTVSPEVTLALGAVPLGYVRYYIDPDKIYASQAGRPTRAEQLAEIERAALERLSAGEAPDPDARPAPWYRLGVIPVLDGIANGRSEPMILGSANHGRITALPAELTVEGPVRFPAPSRTDPLDLIELPPIPAMLLARHAVYEQLALEAAADPEPGNIRRALLANPMIATSTQAEIVAQALTSRYPALAPAEIS